MKKKHNLTKLIIWAVIAAILCTALGVGNSIAAKWDGPLTGFFGSYVSASDAQKDDRVFIPDDEEAETIDFTAENVSRAIIEEGTVLLKNDGALPLTAGSKISVFGVSSAFWMTGEKIDGVANAAFTKALENQGFEINKDLRSFYKSNKHKKFGTGSSMGNGSNFSNWAIDEVPWSEYTDKALNSFASYQDAAFVVFSRGGSEGSDLPMWMDAQGGTYDQSYMSLTQEERDLLTGVTASFDTVIVVLHSANAMDMDFLRDYDIDAVLWVPGTGDTDLTQLAELIAGVKDFSGRTVDTYVYNNMTANPAVQNFGDFRYTDAAGNLLDYSYVNYAEGIYVGYRYYETRYEDTVLGNDASGWQYDETVAFPFGYGLSYNAYAWSNMKASASGGHVTVTVDVTNNGGIPGKDVVEVYVQAPYAGDAVEAAAVELVGFAKTGTLQPGATETVTITFDQKDAASWDSAYAHDGVTGAYRTAAGDVYVTCAANAHQAVQNILAAKGAAVEDGEAALTAKAWTNSEAVYYTKADSGELYQNHFADAALADAVYLSRANWSAVEDGSLVYQDGSKASVSNVMAADGKVYTHVLSDTLKAAMEMNGWASSGNPDDPASATAFPAIKTGVSGSLSFAGMTQAAYDDPRWETLLDQLTLEEMENIFAFGGYGTYAIDSIGKPATKEYDGPARILNLYNSETSYVYPAECMLAATWNVELAEAMGSNIGDECLLNGISGWYAPAMNIHRTAFSGRNFEYYSEDSLLSGKMAAAETVGVQRKGVYAYIKHFAMNDQESNRGANGRYAAFSTEQAVREIYLEAFRIPVAEGGAKGVMASMNRIGPRWSVTNYDLLQGTLRNEWGFNGIVVTDYISSLDEKSAEAGVAAGLDLQLITYANHLSADSLALPGVQSRLREVAHHVLWVQANSLVANNYDFGYPIYKILLYALAALIAVYLLWSLYLVIKYSLVKADANGKAARIAGADKVIAIILAAILGVLLIFVLYWFFTAALPALRQAFTL